MSRRARMIAIACVAALAAIIALGATANADDGTGTDGTRITGSGGQHDGWHS